MSPTYTLVAQERLRQDTKWGVQNCTNLEWLAILGEEFGEVSQEVVESHFSQKSNEDLKDELIQVAAVAIAWLECLERNGV